MLENRFTNENKKNTVNIWLIVILSIILLTSIIFGLMRLEKISSVKEQQYLEDTLKKAAVHSYAMTGKYPDSVETLIDKYGIVYEEKNYFIYFNVFADNVMPTIEVRERTGLNE